MFDESWKFFGYTAGVPLTLNFQGQIVSREWDAQLSWNERDRSRQHALM